MDNDDRKIILLFGNDASCHPQDERGRTPLHDLAMIQGASAEADAEFAAAAEQMINIFLNTETGIKFGILDKDQEGHTALDLALKMNPEVEEVKKVFIKYSLIADPNLAKPLDLTPSLSICWDKEKERQLKTNSQANTSNRAAFFQASTSANSATYDEHRVQTRPRFN